MSEKISKKEYKTFKEIEAYILNLRPIKPDNKLMRQEKPFNIERVRYILNILGNPHIVEKSTKNGKLKEQSYIHITGTSGKGSVAHLTADTLSKLGYTVGVFTSPHVTSVIERIQVGGLYISPSTFVRIFKHIRPILEDIQKHKVKYIPSFFDVSLIMAFIYFKEASCDFVILEAGIGGRHDSTNIVEHPLVTAITNIGIDHTEFLGKTKTLIAQDKAGIIKKGSTFFTTETNSRMLSIFKKACNAKGVTMHCVGGSNFQYQNSELANTICLHICKMRQKDSRLAKTFKVQKIKLPARFETLQKGPTVIIDGAHNPSKIKSVVERVQNLTYRKLVVLVAISADKDLEGILKEIIPIADKIRITKFSTPRPFHSPEIIYQKLLKLGYMMKDMSIETNVATRFKDICKDLQSKDILLVTGSFYLASDIRKLYFPEKRILKSRKWR